MKFYIIAGEASGDLHGSNLIRAIQKQTKDATFRAWGGDLMQAAGAEIVKNYRDLAFMGFVEVVSHLGTILNNLKFAKEDILNYQPDVIIFIDYPGFNLRMTEWAHKKGFKTCYYISPTVWAWKENRVEKIRKYVDRMMVILPFEKPFYEKHQMKVDYVGHPLVEVIDASLKIPLTDHIVKGKPVIALLPGSRTQEIQTKLPVMMKMVDAFPEYDFVIGQAPGQDEPIYQQIIGNRHVRLLKNRTYDIMKEATAALVTSGTATLETALFGVPQVVCYRANSVSYWIAKRLVKIKYISLVNLILNKMSVIELIQDDLNESNLKQALSDLLYNKEKQEQIQSDYTALWELLYPDHNASENAAKVVLSLVK